RWSPDGKRIAFYSTRSGSFEIWLINADGTGLRRLTEMGNDKAFNPVWTPDGKKLSFANIRGEAWLIEPDKPWLEQSPQMLNPKREPPLQFWPADWTSDGRKLVLGSNLDQQSLVISVFSFDTGSVEKISDVGGVSMAWFKDARRMLFIL